ncbi:pentapeptide repeat-containing protein [Umezawaea sp. Da 62-37]|uniref:pentapeptide repeat-containing protein n=1 Tax=Umezawaea sp. Da 62-37 TaxID=3075927 RepID=UPI0028F743E1|nr:pentapeptide repeat-containing protein [Umezawaea sp. Da 62-37]WNV83716.1 pentapeptide repeat-containing protein [Umezawaea sp. Da 62-37]
MPDDATAEAGSYPSVQPDWPTCMHEDGLCAGRLIDGYERCLTHLSPDELDGWLQSISVGADLDLRGTKFADGLLDRLLTRVAKTPGGFNSRTSFGTVDLRCCRIPETELFLNAHFAGYVDFSGAVFFGAAKFTDSTFTRGAGFVNATFARGDASFDGVMFNGNVKFLNAKFERSALFKGATFFGSAWFIDTKFMGDAGFNRVKFNEDVGFNRATFARDARFGRAEFARGLWVDDATFARVADFSRAVFTSATKFGPVIAESVALDEALFVKRVVAEVEAGWVSTQGTRFDGGVELRVRQARLWLRRTSFGASSSVSRAVAPFTPAINEKSGGESAERAKREVGMVEESQSPTIGTRRGVIGVEVPTPQVLSLQETDVSQLTLSDVDVQWCRFAGAHQLEKLRLEGRSPFNQPPAGWRAGWAWFPVWHWSRRRVLAEEHLWRSRSRKSSGWTTALPSFERLDVTSQSLNSSQSSLAVEPERLAVLYRSLRKSLEDGKNEAGAGDFYYGEMEARRHTSSAGAGERFVLGVYWLLSGYGQRASRALTALALLVGVLFAGLTYYGLPDTTTPTAPLAGTVRSSSGQSQQVIIEISAPTKLPPVDQRWTAERVDKAARIALGSVVFRDTDQKLTTAGLWMLMVGRALGPLLLALAALAIRARVKR